MKNNKIIGEVFRFLLIGAFATIVDYAIFYLFRYLILSSIPEMINIPISTFLGFSAGLIINWVFSARFVYRYNKKTTNKQFIMYVILCVLGLVITEVGLLLAKPLYETLYITIFVKIDFWQLFFKCLMTLIVLVLNYFGRKYLIFRK